MKIGHVAVHRDGSVHIRVGDSTQVLRAGDTTDIEIEVNMDVETRAGEQQKFTAIYTISRGVGFETTGTMDEIRSWVAGIEARHTISASVFDQGPDGFYSASENTVQWGTGRWWLRVSKA